jgi:predicted oxidoreductase
MNSSKFSRIIAGTMNWGVWGKKYNTFDMAKMIHCCISNNITSFDHADIYGDYTNEADFGKAFIESRIDRASIQLISKCGIQMKVWVRNNSIKHYEYSKEYIIWSVETSLKNLQTDYLDLLLLHRPSPLMQIDEIASAIDILKSDGKILDFGVSNFTPSQTALIQQKTNISYNQIEFSLTHCEAMTNGNLDAMQLNNIIPMSWAPLGTFFKNQDAQPDKLKNAIITLSDKYGVSEDVILLSWILKHPSGILPVIGTTDPSRIIIAAKSMNVELELQDWFALWSASLGSDVP